MTVLPRPAVDEGTAAVIEKGIRVSLGSGWPSASLNPFVSLEAAVSRGFTVERGLAALTAQPAFAEFQESEKGTIARGRLADMVILSDDPLAVPATHIKEIRALTVIAGGRSCISVNPDDFASAVRSRQQGPQLVATGAATGVRPACKVSDPGPRAVRAGRRFGG